MRLAGIYLNDDEVFALADRLRELGLDDVANRLGDAYYRDVKDFDMPASVPNTLLPALEGGPASFAALLGVLTIDRRPDGAELLVGC